MRATHTRSPWAASAAALALVGLAALLVAQPLSARRSAGGITVFVTCALKQQNHTFDAIFGYENTTGAPQIVATGVLNRFVPAAPSGRQPPTTFATGRVDRAVFVANIPTGTTTAWRVEFGGTVSTATASADAAHCSTQQAPGSSTTTTTTPATPPTGPVDVTLTKTVAPTEVETGHNVVYTLRATNNGPRTAVQVRMIDRLPAGLVLVSASAAHGHCTQSQPVICTVASLAVGAAATARLVTRVDARSAVTNTAVVTALQPETTTANNAARALLLVKAPKKQTAPPKPAVHAQPHFTG